MISGDVKAVSDRDLSLSLAFIVKISPGDLANKVLAGNLSTSDEQLTAHGTISRAGSAVDFAGVHLDPGRSARIVIQRQFYVGRGYNCEQAIAGFFPVPQGTLVVYGNRAFTDQVSGIGGSTKRSIGRRVMGSTLKKIFERARTAAEKP